MLSNQVQLAKTSQASVDFLVTLIILRVFKNTLNFVVPPPHSSDNFGHFMDLRIFLDTRNKKKWQKFKAKPFSISTYQRNRKKTRLGFNEMRLFKSVI